jgi:hypothetical protein
MYHAVLFINFVFYFDVYILVPYHLNPTVILEE